MNGMVLGSLNTHPCPTVEACREHGGEPGGEAKVKAILPTQVQRLRGLGRRPSSRFKSPPLLAVAVRMWRCRAWVNGRAGQPLYLASGVLVTGPQCSQGSTPEVVAS